MFVQEVAIVKRPCIKGREDILNLSRWVVGFCSVPQVTQMAYLLEMIIPKAFNNSIGHISDSRLKSKLKNSGNDFDSSLEEFCCKGEGISGK